MLLTAKYTDIGGREINEDSCGIFVKDGCICAVVADGVGGHGGGDQASRFAVAMIEAFYNESAEHFPTEHILEWFQRINNEVCRHQTKECKMRTTLSVLFVDDNSSYWAYVGDSRLYHFENNRLVKMSVDHSVSQMAVFSGEITQEEVRHHADRNKLVRAIGNSEEIKAELSDMYDVTCGDHAFLICSDGFWEYVVEDEMEETLKESQNPVQWISKMSNIVKEKAPENNDNNTAVAVWVKNS